MISIQSKGKILKKFLENQNVETKWKQNNYIDWLSGDTIIKELANPKDSFNTHCSAFVASICKQLNINILGPPDVRTEGLANLQYDWLNNNNIENGWNNIDNAVATANAVAAPVAAQIYANNGYLVLMCYKNEINPNGGHIACVKPHMIDTNEVLNQGPQLCQAGKINSSSISASLTFSKQNQPKCKFYYHDIIL